MQYRNGQIVSTGAAMTVKLGFVPDRFAVWNLTALAAQSGVGYSEWMNNILPPLTADTYINTYTSGAPVTSAITTNGITPVVLGADYQNTNYVITGITNAAPGVVTLSSLTPTNSMTLVNGMTITISAVVGMTQLNTRRFIVAGISGSTFMLYDTFGNPVSTVGFGTYVSGGIVNVISYPPTAPVLNPINGQVVTPGSPAGLQYDIGYEGVIIGTTSAGSSTNILYYEAYLNTPTGY